MYIFIFDSCYAFREECRISYCSGCSAVPLLLIPSSRQNRVIKIGRANAPPPRKGVRMTQREIDITILDFLLWVISEGSQPSWFPPEKKIANECNCERRKSPVMQRENPRSISPFRDSCYDIGEAGRSHIRIERRTDLDCAHPHAL